MKKKIFKIILTRPLYLFLLPLYFVVHGYFENYKLVSFTDAFLILAVYIPVAYLLGYFLYPLFKERYKANIFTFFLLCINFFFGPFYDIVSTREKNSLWDRYAFLLSIVFVLIILIAFTLKKIKRLPLRLRLYINSLCFLLLFTDLILGVLHTRNYDPRKFINGTVHFTKTDSDPRPDIYFIVSDGYAGEKELTDVFNFNDSVFYQQLEARGFHIVKNTFSNYNSTPYSLASTLNMNYLKVNPNDNQNNQFKNCYRAIRHNFLFDILDSMGYKNETFSIFDFGNKDFSPEETLLPVRTGLLEAPTLVGHLTKIIRYNLAEKFKSESMAGNRIRSALRMNTYNYNSTVQILGQPDTVPRLVYTHLLMPHSPYYKDKNGNDQPFESLLEHNSSNKHNYIEYLQYTNSKLIELIDKIKKKSSQPPIIILMSDHGWRRFTKEFDQRYDFINLMAVLLPDKKYDAFPDGVSNVNLFRILLNDQFGQHLPILQDSTVYLRRPQ